MFDALDISSSALTAQRIRMDTIAGNVANANTTRDAAGKPNPYRRRAVVFATGQPNNPSAPGVHVQEISLDQTAFRKLNQPGHPDADKDGNVLFPNVDPAIESVDMLSASRAYEASVTAMDVTKSMLNASLRLIA